MEAITKHDLTAENFPCPDCDGTGTVTYAGRTGRYHGDPQHEVDGPCQNCDGEGIDPGVEPELELYDHPQPMTPAEVAAVRFMDDLRRSMAAVGVRS